MSITIKKYIMNITIKSVGIGTVILTLGLMIYGLYFAVKSAPYMIGSVIVSLVGAVMVLYLFKTEGKVSNMQFYFAVIFGLVGNGFVLWLMYYA